MQKEKKRIYGSHLQYDGASRSAERRFYGFRTGTERVPVASVDDFAWKISSRGTEETGIRGTTCQELHLRECICLRSHEPSFYPVDLTQRPFTLKLRAPSAPPPPAPSYLSLSCSSPCLSQSRHREGSVYLKGTFYELYFMNLSKNASEMVSLPRLQRVPTNNQMERGRNV